MKISILLLLIFLLLDSNLTLLSLMAFLFLLHSFSKVKHMIVLVFRFLLFVLQGLLFVIVFLLMGLQTLRSFYFLLLFLAFLSIGLFKADPKLLIHSQDFIKIELFTFEDSFVFLMILSFVKLVTLCYYRHYLYLFEFLINLQRFFLLLP